MRIGELARRAGVTPKALRYYEAMGLVTASRLPNGYRDYDDEQVALVREVHALNSLGIRVDRTRPFLRCLTSGNDHGDDCPDSLATYREAIDEMDARMSELSERRERLASMLESASSRTQPLCQFTVDDEELIR